MTIRLFVSPVTHDVRTRAHTHSHECVQVAQILKFVATLKSRLGACETGEGEINWAV